MPGQRCPYCKERVKRGAIICRHCHMELHPDAAEAVPSPLSVVAGFLGLAAGAGLVLFYGYLRERRKWQDEGVHFVPSESEEA